MKTVYKVIEENFNIPFRTGMTEKTMNAILLEFVEFGRYENSKVLFESESLNEAEEVASKAELRKKLFEVLPGRMEFVFNRIMMQECTLNENDYMEDSEMWAMQQLPHEEMVASMVTKKFRAIREGVFPGLDKALKMMDEYDFHENKNPEEVGAELMKRVPEPLRPYVNAPDWNEYGKENGWICTKYGTLTPLERTV